MLKTRLTRFSTLLAVGASALALGASAASASPADLDPRFSEDGWTAINSGGTESGQAVAVQADGKTVVAGYTTANGDAVVYRLTKKGALDTTFSGDGAAVLDLGGVEATYDVAIQPDGKIVVVGFSLLDMNAQAWRLNANGSLDTTFDGDGRAVLNAGGFEIAYAVALQADGKILVAGQTSVDDNGAVWRLNPNGSLDTTFSGDGFVGVDSFGFESLDAVAVQRDGKIVIAGHTTIGDDATVYRLNANGSFDTTFDGDGQRQIDSGGTEIAYDMAVQPDGKILVAGSSTVNGDAVVYRLNPNGALDPTFDGDGALGLDSGGTEVAYALELQQNGKILVAGSTTDGNDAVIFRVKPDGSRDVKFDGDGELDLDIGGFQTAFGLALLPSGKIMVSGTTNLPSDAMVVRLKGDKVV